MFVSSRGKEYKEALTSFRRGLRSRDERYPALLTNKDQPCDKAEKMYEFGSDYVSSSGRGGGGGYLSNGGCYPGVALTTTDYSLAAAAGGGGEESSSLRDGGGQQQIQMVSCHQENGGSTRLLASLENGGGVGGNGRGTNLTTYARIQPCPQCVRRQCQCLLETTYVKRDCDAKHPSGGTVMEAPAFGSMLFLQQMQQATPPPQQPQRLRAVDASSTKACVISLFQSDSEDGGLHSMNRLNPADLPDLHPLSSGCGPSPAAAASSDPGRLASLDQYDDDDDDPKHFSQPQQH